MRRLISMVILIFMIAVNANAQHKFGDIEVFSFEEVFNPDNKKLWKGKNIGGSYKFNPKSSEVWIDYNILSGLTVDSKYVNMDVANFVANDNFDANAIYERLKNQLNEQFGEPEEINDIPFIGGTSDGFKWMHQEEQKSYSLLLQKNGQFVALSIQKLEEIPDF